MRLLAMAVHEFFGEWHRQDDLTGSTAEEAACTLHMSQALQLAPGDGPDDQDRVPAQQRVRSHGHADM